MNKPPILLQHLIDYSEHFVRQDGTLVAECQERAFVVIGAHAGIAYAAEGNLRVGDMHDNVVDVGGRWYHRHRGGYPASVTKDYL